VLFYQCSMTFAIDSIIKHHTKSNAIGSCRNLPVHPCQSSMASLEEHTEHWNCNLQSNLLL